MKSGFIYLWYDKKHKKFYLGSHLRMCYKANEKHIKDIKVITYEI